jgi:hypothetical protein
MKFLQRFRSASTDEPDPAPAAAVGADDGRLPIPGYDELGDKQLIAALPPLSQVDLATVEAHERAHRARPAVLDKVRWLTGDEPLPNYDTLSAQEAIDGFPGANAEVLKDVRDYERRHRRRHDVLEAVDKAIPDALASPGESRAREEKADLVQSARDHAAANRPAPRS